MSLASLTTSRLGHQGIRWLEPLLQFARRHRAAWPAAGIVAATVAGYHYTLTSLGDFLRLNSPLAFLTLLPFVSVAVAIVAARRFAGAPKPLQDRQHDLMAGIAMLLVAVLLVTWVPIMTSTNYWTHRLDVLSLVLFAAGATILVYGVNWFGRVKAAFVFLLLMWPTPYLFLMDSVIQPFSNAINVVLAQVVDHLPLGVNLFNQPGLLIVNEASGARHVVAVGSASSGGDSIIAFAIIGAAVIITVAGGRTRKLRWLVAGMALTLLLNLLRLAIILVLAEHGVPGPATGADHAVISLVLLVAAATIMVWALPYFGLQRKDPVAGLGDRIGASPPAKRISTRRQKLAVALALTITGVLAFANHGLQPYAAFDDGTGSPTVHPFSAVASAPAGWSVRHIAGYLWATQYFGVRATWDRYTISAPEGHNVTVADIVRTNDKGSLDVCNPQNCFLFRSADIVTSNRIDLGKGVYGLLLNYSDRATKRTWATVSWIWPVNAKGETFYERIVLTSSPFLVPASKTLNFKPAGGLQDIFMNLLNGVTGGRDNPTAMRRYRDIDNAVRSQAQVLVAHALRRGA